MYLRKSVFTLLLILCNVFVVVAQTTADSLVLVTAHWNVTSMGKGVLCREAEFVSLYGVPQHVAILEIKPEQHRFDILIHSPKEETSSAARRSGALVAINGSYFNIKQGTSICYLRKDGVVVDTTATGVLSTVSNGAVKIDKGKLDIIAWKKQDEKTCEQKEGRTVFLIAVAGRFEGKAEGINIPELTHLLRVLGAKKALNLDGGGSTTLWSASAPDNGIVNKLTDNKLYDNKGERKVANSLCVYE